MSELMAEVSYPHPKSAQPISHVVPGVYVRQHGVTVETTDELKVVVSAAGAGQVTLTQQQFAVLMSWQSHLIHQDWE